LLGSLFADITNSQNQIHGNKKMISEKKRGRPATGRGDGVLVRLHPDLMKQLDQWRARDPDLPTRPEAIRRLIQHGLKFKWKST
jgi:hypothetical protein